MRWYLALVMAVVTVLSGLALIAVGTACPTEDSPHCVWWGPVQGNGHGPVVVNVR